MHIASTDLNQVAVLFDEVDMRFVNGFGDDLQSADRFSVAGRGLGAWLLRDAMTRTLAASETIGVRAMLVHAIDEDARAFYLRHRASGREVLQAGVGLDLATPALAER